MEMVDPPSFKNKKNPNANGDIDYSNTSPLATDGSNFPCKGYHKLLGTPAGAAVAHWKPGSTQSITIAGQAWHNGGSCQISLSLDGGKSFTVIHSYIGNCPSGPGDRSMSFRIPSDAPSSDSVLLSWSWFNNLGNREFYHQCAPITMSGKRRRGSEKVSFNSRPQIFMANIGNGCKTIETKDVLFPNPGPDVTVNNGNTEPPVGDCGLSRGGVEWSGPSSDQLPPPDLSSPEVPPTSGNDDSPNFGDGE
jgi:hypothetical protein